MWSLADGSTTWQDLVIEPDSPTAFHRWVALAQSNTPDNDNVDLALTLTRIVEAAYTSADQRRDQES
jgi:hypothetical protein